MKHGTVNPLGKRAQACTLPSYALHDDDALSGGRVHIHVVHASPSSPDDFEVAGGLDDIRCDFGRGSDHEAVVVLKDRENRTGLVMVSSERTHLRSLR